MNSVIHVHKLSKRYFPGAGGTSSYETLRESLASAFSRGWRRRRAKPVREVDILWALKDVSFDIGRGEVVGIIGRNGAGKSTLLKILSRIAEPTAGRAEIRGRVGSLLEVGTGFHPELTGRENIYLNGLILGMRRGEITRKLDEIVAFSEIERFLDTPVKRYSSGMYVRLAFAVAAHLEPEILIVDEVLAVGDAGFQKKCLGKMRDVSNHGRTILFVSHNMQAVQSLCSRAIWLQNGQVQGVGPATKQVADYLRQCETSLLGRSWNDPATAPGNEAIRLRRIRVTPESNEHDSILPETPLQVEFEYWNLKPEIQLNLSVHVFYSGGIAFCTTSQSDPNWHGKRFPRGLYRSTFRIPGDLLNQGAYRLDVMFVKDSCEVLFKFDDAIIFEVKDGPRAPGEWMGNFPGVVRPRLAWTTDWRGEELAIP